MAFDKARLVRGARGPPNRRMWSGCMCVTSCVCVCSICVCAYMCQRVCVYACVHESYQTRSVIAPRARRYPRLLIASKPLIKPGLMVAEEGGGRCHILPGGEGAGGGAGARWWWGSPRCPLPPSGGQGRVSGGGERHGSPGMVCTVLTASGFKAARL